MGCCPQWRAEAQSREGRTHSRSHRGSPEENEGGSWLSSAKYLSLVSGGSFWKRPEFLCSKSQVSAKLEELPGRLHAGL